VVSPIRSEESVRRVTLEKEKTPAVIDVAGACN
jgi:hypothetical protein